MKQRIIQVLKKIASYANVERVVFVCLILGIVFISRCNIQKETGVIQALTNSTHLWKDKYGNSHATNQTLILQQANLNKLLDSQAKILSIKPKQVIQYVKSNAKIDTNLYAHVDTVWKTDTVILADGSTHIDSSRIYHLSYRDSTFLTVEGLVPQTPQRLDVKATMELSFTQYWKRQKGLFGLRIGQKQEFTDVGTNNPYIQFTNSVSYKSIPPRVLRVRPGIGPTIVVNPLTSKVNWGIGAGIMITYGR